MKFLSIVLLLFSLILESSITTIPLVFISLLVLTVVYKDNFIFLLAFIFGILLDLLYFKNIGASSIYFVIFLFLVLIYQSKFEITTNIFVLIASFFGSLGFLLLFSYENSIIFQAIAGAIIGLIMFKFLQKTNKKLS